MPAVAADRVAVRPVGVVMVRVIYRPGLRHRKVWRAPFMIRVEAGTLAVKTWEPLAGMVCVSSLLLPARFPAGTTCTIPLAACASIICSIFELPSMYSKTHPPNS